MSKVNYIFLDTETDGVHIINNRPFSYQVANMRDTPRYFTLNKSTLEQLKKELIKPNTWLIGHNIKFDVHMLINAGIPIETFKNIRIIDTMFMARLAIDHDEQAGNPKFKKPPISLSLKKLSEKYLGADSRDEELQLKDEFKKLNTKHKLEFKVYLTGVLERTPKTEELNKYYKYTEADKHISKYPYDKTLLDICDHWHKLHPAPTYKDIPRYILEPYAIKDIILTRGLFRLFFDVIKSKNQLDVFVRESKALYPLILMEREGLVIDKQEAINKYKELFIMRDKLNVVIAPVPLIKIGAVPIATYYDLTVPSSTRTDVVYSEELELYLEYNKADILVCKGEQVNTRSTPQMAALYTYETGKVITTANKETREEIINESPTAKKIQMLRPLDKIIDTYLYRLINEPIYIDDEWKLFGTYNNLSDSYGGSDDTAGTITGRLSSDLQQFPKEPLLDDEGNELVNIRRLFIKPKDAYAMVYFDMSQLELRLQTIWSAIISGKPDKVMARGFGPYDCYEKFDGDGNSLGWFLNESPEVKWTPTDFHTATAHEAFSKRDDYEMNRSHYRSLGKRANFAIGYGASKWKIMESLKVPEADAQSLVDGWKKTYAGLTKMDQYLRVATRVNDHQTNLFGRRYYTREVHKLKNWLVQGSGGDLLKIFLARLIPFVEKYPHWKLMLTVHDEIDFVVTKKPTKEEVEEVLSLMYYEAGGIEVTSDVEITYKSWADQETFVV